MLYFNKVQGALRSEFRGRRYVYWGWGRRGRKNEAGLITKPRERRLRGVSHADDLRFK